MGRLVSVGRVLKTHGLRGEVTVVRYGDSEGLLIPGRVFQVSKDARVLTLTLASVRPGPNAGWLATFEGIQDPEAAKVLVGSSLSLDEADMPPPEEGRHYWFQLLGLMVRTAEGRELGVIEDIFETGANDIYVVTGPQGEILIPSTKEIVQETNVDDGYMVITPLPGLLPEEL